MKAHGQVCMDDNSKTQKTFLEEFLNLKAKRLEFGWNLV
jgi:hypothetical protein